MIWNAVYSGPSQDDLDWFESGPRAAILKAVRNRLVEGNPLERDTNRKPLDPPDEHLGAWELRVRGIYRVFYGVDVETNTVHILRIGHKPKEVLYLRGKGVSP